MGLGKKLKKGIKSVGKGIESVGKGIEKGVKSGLRNMDPTSVDGRANLLSGLVTAPFGPKKYWDKLTGKSGSGSGDSEADSAYAQLMRDKWDHFADKDMPYILDYSKRIASGQDITDSVKQANHGVSLGMGLEIGNLQRQQAGLGLALSDQQRKDQTADQLRAKTAALVDAENSAYTAAKDRQNALLAGANIPSLKPNDPKLM